MNKWYIGGIVGLSVVALGVCIQLSLQGRTIPKIKYSQVETPERMGQAVFDRLSQELKEESLIVFGVTPNEIHEIELINGFIAEAGRRGVTYQVISVEPELPYVEILPANLRVAMKDELLRFAEGVKSAHQQKQKVIAIVPNIYASQLLKGNPADAMKNQFAMDPLSISVSPYPRSYEEMKDFKPACMGRNQPDPSGLSPFTCTVQDLSKKVWRKKAVAGQYTGLMEQTGLKDYVVIFNNPIQ